MAVSWRVFIALGLPFLFIPINTLCYAGIPQEKYNEVSGLTALMRNLGGSVGISFITTLLARLSQRHLAMLVAHTAPGNPPFERCAQAWPAHGCSAARACPMPCTTPAHRSTAWPMPGPAAGLRRCHLGHGRRDHRPGADPVPDAAAKEGGDGGGALRSESGTAARPSEARTGHPADREVAGFPAAALLPPASRCRFCLC